MHSAFPLPVFTFLINGLSASRPPDTKGQLATSLCKWKTFILNEVRMAQELLCPFCVLRASSFSLRLGSSVGIPLWSAGSAPQAAVEISPNDSGGLRGLSLTSLVAGMASSGTARFVKPARISFNRRATASFVALAEPQILTPKQIDFAILIWPRRAHHIWPTYTR